MPAPLVAAAAAPQAMAVGRNVVQNGATALTNNVQQGNFPQGNPLQGNTPQVTINQNKSFIEKLNSIRVLIIFVIFCIIGYYVYRIFSSGLDFFRQGIGGMFNQVADITGDLVLLPLTAVGADRPFRRIGNGLNPINWGKKNNSLKKPGKWFK